MLERKKKKDKLNENVKISKNIIGNTIYAFHKI